MTNPHANRSARRGFLGLGPAALLGGSVTPRLLGAFGAPLLGGLLGATAARAADYKALVCVHLFGGNDGLNMIVPSDAAGHARYASVRGPLAIARDRLLPLPGASHGLHPALAALVPLWNERALAPVFNVGPLVRPTSRADVLAADETSSSLPERLFSHPDQQTAWDTATPRAPNRAGWGGRASQQLAPEAPVISVAGTSRFGSSAARAPLVLPGPGTAFGSSLIDPGDNRVPERARREAITALYAQATDSSLAEVYSATQREAHLASQRLAPLVATTPGSPGAVAAIDAAFAPLIRGNAIATGLGTQLYQVAQLIAGRDVVQGSRRIFFTSLGGFDTHRAQMLGGDPMLGRHAPLLQELGDALAAFHAAMRALGLGEAVTAFTQTEFGRTWAPNETGGTDHGWGNMHLVVGGAVQGGRTYGDYPELALGGPDDAGGDGLPALGRWIPTLSVEQYAATLLGWFGADHHDLDAILPGLANFGTRRTVGFL